MYTPRHFAGTPDEALALVAAHPLATLVSAADDPDRPHVSLVPLVRDGDDLVGHLANANPHAAALAGPATAIFRGVQGYISPRWYASDGQVPTWNYEAVEVRGRVQPVSDPEDTMRIVDTLTAHAEAHIAGPAWRADWSDPRLARMLRHITAFRLVPDTITCKRKLSQNRTAADVAGAIDALQDHGPELARRMQPRG